MTDSLEPDTVAHLDQKYAAARDLIDHMVRGIRLDDNRQIELMGLAVRVDADAASQSDLAFMLSAAIIRIAELERGDTDAR